MRIITITGSSGAGKDTVAKMLSEETGYPVICSYTTRPKRKGEQEGREHHFVESCNVPREKMLAYTKYGQYEYWTEMEQLRSNTIYVIDEDGIRSLMVRFPMIPMIHVYVDASEMVRLSRGVTTERMVRDLQRLELPSGCYHYHIQNNGSWEMLKDEVKKMAHSLFWEKNNDM